MHFADNLGPDQLAHLCSVIWAFSVCQHILQYPLILKADNKGQDQPALKHKADQACFVYKLHKGSFHVLYII